MQMSKLLADNRYPISTIELFERRVKDSADLPDWIENDFNTGDLVIYNGSTSDYQEIKFVLTTTRTGVTDFGKFALGFINTKSHYVKGGVNLTGAYNSITKKKIANGYDALQGNSVIALKRKDIGILQENLTLEQVLNHKGWRILARHPDEVPEEFAEDFEIFKEYTGKVVFFRHNKAMGMATLDGGIIPMLKAWHIGRLGSGSDACGSSNLEYKYVSFVGVAPIENQNFEAAFAPLYEHSY